MKDLEELVYRHLEERGWNNLRPADIAKSIMIEGAELLELFQWDGLSLSSVRKDQKKINNIEKELADVLIYCLEMSVLLKLDTDKIIRAKLRQAAKKYPAKLMRDNQSRKPGADNLYWKIKEEYRRKGK